MQTFETKQQLQQFLKEQNISYQTIVEGEELYWVYTKKGTLKFHKPISKETALAKIQVVTPATPFESLLEFINNPIKNKAYYAIKHFLKTQKKVLLLTGSAGAGKTTVSLYGLYHFIRKGIVSNPLYFSVITDIRREDLHLKVIEADGFVIDDLNISVGDYDLKIARKIILYALENDYPLFITSNNTVDQLTTKIFEQHIRSRLEGKGLIMPIKDKDYRVLKALGGDKNA